MVDWDILYFMCSELIIMLSDPLIQQAIGAVTIDSTSINADDKATEILWLDFKVSERSKKGGKWKRYCSDIE